MTEVLVTAGPTREHLDDVRFLTNGSSGRMGYAIAEAALAAGHSVVLVTGPTSLPVPKGAEAHCVTSALQMEAAVVRCLERADVVFGVAAVADARPAVRRAGKPPKGAGPEQLELIPNPDIIAGVGARKGRRAVIGFALESPGEGGMEVALRRAHDKLVRKQLDAIAVNLACALGAESSEVVLLRADGTEERLPRQSKRDVARRLVEVGIELWRAKQ